MLVTLAAVLALAGAPASTRVDCNPQLPASVDLGLTVSDEATIIGGAVVMGPLDHVQLGPLACFALAYGDASTWGRFRMAEQTLDSPTLVGVGLQVALHEAEHVALDSQDECLVEKTARAKVSGLIDSVALSPQLAEAAATASDAELPAQYHGC